ncbi:hypothetical protein ACVBE9_10145 [Eionea flava]
MYENLPEEILDDYKIPKHFKRNFVLLIFAIFLTGIAISLYSEDWTWLGRMGGVMVITSLLLEASGVVDKVVEYRIKHTKKDISDLVDSFVKENPKVFGLEENYTPERFAYKVTFETENLIFRIKNNDQKKSYKELRVLEFVAGSIGTFLWAFSDLLNCILWFSEKC